MLWCSILIEFITLVLWSVVSALYINRCTHFHILLQKVLNCSMSPPCSWTQICIFIVFMFPAITKYQCDGWVNLWGGNSITVTSYRALKFFYVKQHGDLTESVLNFWYRHVKFCIGVYHKHTYKFYMKLFCCQLQSWH